jgi:uncharacterized delta-60 repeat protein
MKGLEQRSSPTGMLLSCLTWLLGLTLVGAAPGDLDLTFTPVLNGSVAAAAVDSSTGKIVIGGDFTSVNGTNRNCIARLNADGSLDLGFDPGSYPGRPVRQLLLSAGKVLVNVGDTVVRLNSDGSRDLPTTNNPPPAVNGWNEPVLGPNKSGAAARVNVMAHYSSTFVYLGGDFLSIWDTASGTYKTRYAVARLKADGTLDTAFVPAIGDSFFPETLDLAVLSGAKVLVAGYVTASNGYGGVFRLNFSGTVDTGFGIDYQLIWTGNRLVVQPDGKILFGGIASYMAGGRSRFWRLNPDGSSDPTFSQGPAYPFCGGPAFGFVPPILLQANGRIVTQFMTNVPTFPNPSCALDRVVRLNSDGSWDPTFHRAYFKPLASQPDGKLLVSDYSDPATGTARAFARLTGRCDGRFESIKRLTNGTVRLQLSGEPGQNYGIEASGNLTLWTPLATNSSPIGLWEFVDATATNVTQRFYRTVTVP